MKRYVKEGDVMLCESNTRGRNDLVINVKYFGSEYIEDKDGTQYRKSELNSLYHKFYAM